MGKLSAALPLGYEELLQEVGLHDVAIRHGAKGDIMSASEELRAGMAEAIERFAVGGMASLPERFKRLRPAWYPKWNARPCTQIVALTPPNASAFGVECTINGRSVLLITAVGLYDADGRQTRSAFHDVGEEALRVSTWAAKQ